MKKESIVVIILIALTLSCDNMEQVIDLEIPPHQSVLVLNGRLDTDKEIKVLLSKDESEFFNVPRNSAGTKWVSFYFDNKNQLLFIDTEISLKKIEIEMINKQPTNDEKI